jgi:hypothetical protein
MLEKVHCPYCSSVQQVVEVHGHSQCIRCGINISPCCSGENAEEEEKVGNVQRS